jgi:Zn-dependent protease with chaperone function
MSGILRPRLIVSPEVRRALTPEQLEAALDHERAHWVSRDNLKRLLMLLSPGLLPFYSGFTRLERAWGRFTEWAADDAAVAGSAARSVSLAAALVSVARLQTSSPPPLATSLLGDSPDLAARVHRLLHRAPRRETKPGSTTALGITSVALALVLLNPSTLYLAHRLLERLME